MVPDGTDLYGRQPTTLEDQILIPGGLSSGFHLVCMLRTSVLLLCSGSVLQTLDSLSRGSDPRHCARIARFPSAASYKKRDGKSARS